MEYGAHKILFFDLDGTLLNSEKRISDRTARAVCRCKERGLKIGICTSRSEQNALAFVGIICPDILITSGGALVKAGNQYISKKEFDAGETQRIIRKLREVVGADCEITVDTVDAHYWNYKVDPNLLEANWGSSVYSDFQDFSEPALKICVEINEEGKADDFYHCFREYDCIRFSDGNWYKITKKNITKENAIREAAVHYGISPEEIIAFGDDLADLGMLNLCGLGIAMGNALDTVKEVSDLVIGSNDQDGIADFLEQEVSGK